MTTAQFPNSARSLPTGYEPGKVEQRIYAFWERNGYFKPQHTQGRKSFVISMPPPNVTGALHTGHFLAATLEDLMIRYHRMLGDAALYVPGEDHAGIATQNVVEKHIAEKKQTRHTLGRENFVTEVWAWVAEYKKRIQTQTRRFGASCDWERERFTLDDGLSRAVREVFARLYEEGLIYRGERIINWCPRCQSAISDLEVTNKDSDGALTYISYPIEPFPGQTEQQREITVATTRPETMLGDTAIAVHPKDPRYTALIGKFAILPLLNRRIPIIADTAVETEFGAGAVKVTPAHDPTDFEIGQRHNLEQIQILGFDAHMTANAGPYQGLDRFEARKRVLEDLAKAGRIVKQEAYNVRSGHCERCDTVIEPLLSKQWFVKMAPLATPALNAVKYGQLKIIPERFEKTYVEWLTNIRDWNISRQLWWGHRIPAWYCGDCGAVTVSREDPVHCSQCGSETLEQDPDVLDTWFSSWLWPFSTLGWPDNTPDLQEFYPTAVLETGYDIIFFWVARMVMAGIHFMGTVPFHTVYLHGLIRDQHGRKVSKSLKNGLDPIDTIDTFGSDALRYTIVTSSTPGNDIKLNPDRIAGGRNFSNKLWNAGRFTLIQTEEYAGPLETLEKIKGKTIADRWIISRAQRVTQSVTEQMNAFQFGEAGRQLYDFFWSEFCDWYLEAAKHQMADGQPEAQRALTARILRAVLDRSLRLLHPFMPFVTEEIWQLLIGADPEELMARSKSELAPPPALITAPWPEADLSHCDEAAEAEFDLLRQMITRIRDAKKQVAVEPSRRIPIIIAAGDHLQAIRRQSALISQLARTEEPVCKKQLAEKPANAIALLVEDIEIYLPMAGLIDIHKEKERLQQEITKTEQLIAQVRAKLSNEQFIMRAKAEIVQSEKDRLATAEETVRKLQEQLSAFH